MLITKSSGLKLLRILPWVLSVNTRYPTIAMRRQQKTLKPVETWTTLEKLQDHEHLLLLSLGSGLTGPV